MDRETFDALARLLATTPSRRSALGALFAAGLTGTLGTADAARKQRGKRRRDRKRRKGKGTGKKGTADLAAQAADCLSPGPSSNMSGCNYDGSDFSGDDLSSSRMVGTTFRNAGLVGTDLSSSNLKNAVFRGATLTCADLSSSQLRNADFRGFAFPGRPTNLMRADLSSSGCAGIQTNARTFICGTIWCDGSVRNDDCPGGPPPGTCGSGEGECSADEEFICNQQPNILCGTPGTGDLLCDCIATVEGQPFCGGVTQAVNSCTAPTCNTSAECPAGQFCASHGCCVIGDKLGICRAECGTTTASELRTATRVETGATYDGR